jgi:hypothetical protein
MDDRRFDELTRALATPSRRGLLKIAAAAGVGLATRLGARRDRTGRRRRGQWQLQKSRRELQQGQRLLLEALQGRLLQMQQIRRFMLDQQ